MKIKLKPFSTPNFVIMVTNPTTRQEGFKDAPSFALSEVDKETLEEMCAEFRKEVMRKAGYEP